MTGLPPQVNSLSLHLVQETPVRSKKLNAHYSALPEHVLKTGLSNFAAYPPEETEFLTTRLWDKYLPRWRAIKEQPSIPRDPEEEKRIVEEVNQSSRTTDLPRHDEHNTENLDYVNIQRSVYPRKGKWFRFSEEQIRRIREAEDASRSRL